MAGHMEVLIEAMRGMEHFPEANTLLQLLGQEQTDGGQMPLRVLQGTVERANQNNTLSQGLHRHGVLAHTLNYWPTYHGYSADYRWPLAKEPKGPLLHDRLHQLAKALIPAYDIFHFHHFHSLTMDWTDYALLKEAGKTVIMQHTGGDVRQASIARTISPYAVVTQDEYAIKRRLSAMAYHVDNCLVPDKETELYVRDYYPRVSVIPAMLDLTRYRVGDESKPGERLLIVHAPTANSTKGSRQIAAAIEVLQARYPIDYQVIENRTHEQTKAICRKADLIIDQLCTGSYGLLSVEAMALGKPVICWISDYMTAHYPADLPIIYANPHTIRDVLEDLLRNRDSLPERGRSGRAYVEQHHDAAKNSRAVLSLYQKLRPAT
jgi:glycosyltransferase involved in cell wall biosynthesis